MLGALTYIGIAMAVLGLAGLGWCILRALRLKRGIGDAEKELPMLAAWNMGSVGIAFMGLGLLIAGMLLG